MQYADEKLFTKIENAAFRVSRNAEELTGSIQWAIDDHEMIENPAWHYKYQDPDDALDLMKEDLACAHSSYMTARRQVDRFDKALRELLAIRREFGEITGITFEQEK